MIDVFSSTLPLVERLFSAMSKPKNVEARLSTIEAYTVCYPLYKTLTCLKGEALGLVIKLAKSLEEDPTLVYFACTSAGGVGLPIKALVDVNLREDLKRASFLLYVPEPIINEFATNQTVRVFLSKITGLLENGEAEKAQKLVNERFHEKYEQGDVQIPKGEVLVKEGLLILLTLARLGADLDKARIRMAVRSYYSAFSSEIGQDSLLYLPLAVLSLFSPPELLKTSSENLSKWRQSVPDPKSNPFIAPLLAEAETMLGFGYEEFKKTFLEIGALIEP